MNTDTNAPQSRPAEPDGNKGETGGNGENTAPWDSGALNAAEWKRRQDLRIAGIEAAGRYIAVTFCRNSAASSVKECVSLNVRCQCRQMATGAIAAYAAATKEAGE